MAYEFLLDSSRRTREKPRTSGLTIISDAGIGLAAQRDMLESSGHLIDYAKIVVGVSALLPTPVLRSKIRAYRESDVRVFPGGMFLETAYAAGCVEEFLAETARLGFSAVEVSDNLVDFPAGERERILERARSGYGLLPLAEVGKKDLQLPAEQQADEAARCLAAGAVTVLVEAIGLTRPGGDNLPATMLARLDARSLTFEVPIDWIAGVHRYDRHRIVGMLIALAGPDVNLANIEPADLMRFEALRWGLGTDGPAAARSRTDRSPAEPDAPAPGAASVEAETP